MSNQPSEYYVVAWTEHLRDGEEEGAKIAQGLDKALKQINKIANGFGGSNCTFRLFKLGDNIPLQKENVVTEQVKAIQQINYHV